MNNEHRKRVFKALLKDKALNFKKVAAMFQLGDTYFSKAERSDKMMLGLIRFAEATEEIILPWSTCEKCNYRNLGEDIEKKYPDDFKGDTIDCLKCGHPLWKT